MSALEVRKIAKQYKIKITKNGKYKTMKELKNEIDKHNETIKGGELSVNNTKQFLKQSYSKKLNDINDYKIDKDLSGQRVQVYHNPQNNKTVVVHRGTDSIQDWGTNLSMALGHKGKRFNHAKKIQKQAEEKYGKNNLITMGHSQGAKWAEMLGNKSNNNEVITLNKPTLPLDLIQRKRVKNNQTDIKTSKDPVSILRGLQKGKKATVMKSKTLNPLKEHSVDVLDRLDENKMLGVPETEGSGVPIRNFIYKKGFDPSKVKNPSIDILNKQKKNSKNTMQTTLINYKIDDKKDYKKNNNEYNNQLLNSIDDLKLIYNDIIINNEKTKKMKVSKNKTKKRNNIKKNLEKYYYFYPKLINLFKFLKNDKTYKINKNVFNTAKMFFDNENYIPLNLKNKVGKRFILNFDHDNKIYNDDSFLKYFSHKKNDAYNFLKNLNIYTSKFEYNKKNDDGYNSDDSDDSDDETDYDKKIDNIKRRQRIV
jgi:hypothetical protein